MEVRKARRAQAELGGTRRARRARRMRWNQEEPGGTRMHQEELGGTKSFYLFSDIEKHHILFDL